MTKAFGWWSRCDRVRAATRCPACRPHLLGRRRLRATVRRCAAGRADLWAWLGEQGPRLGAEGPPGEPVGLRGGSGRPALGLLWPAGEPPYAPEMSGSEPPRGWGVRPAEGRASAPPSGAERGRGRRREGPRGAFSAEHTARLAPALSGRGRAPFSAPGGRGAADHREGPWSGPAVRLLMGRPGREAPLGGEGCAWS